VSAAFLPGPAGAQEDVPLPPPPVVTRVLGTVTLSRNALSDDLLVNSPVLEGDRLTAGAGWAALVWPDGTLVALDQATTIDVTDLRSLRLTRGRIMIVAGDGIEAEALRTTTPDASVGFQRAGQYLLSIELPGDGGPDATLLQVDEGEATLVASGGTIEVRAGQVAIARGNEPPGLLAADALAQAEFRQFALDAAYDLAAPSTPSAAHLPAGLETYGSTLDRYGSWEEDASEGWVWYPDVASDWQPYTVGIWVAAGPYGWYWAGSDSWARPTHHYGRWGMGKRGRWYWRPDRRWAPAWVSWAVGPGYVAWCPLDARGRPAGAPPFGADLYKVDTSGSRHGHPSGSGWITVSARAFGARTPIERVALDWRRLSETDRRAFVTQGATPPRARRGFAYVAPGLARPRARAEDRQPAGASRPPRAGVADPASAADRADVSALPPPASSPVPGFAPVITDPRPYSGPRHEHPDYTPSTPGYRPPGATGGYRAPGEGGTPRSPGAGSYARPTPFVEPRWTSPLDRSSGESPRATGEESTRRPGAHRESRGRDEGDRRAAPRTGQPSSEAPPRAGAARPHGRAGDAARPRRP
jgi:hypothetical protein